MSNELNFKLEVFEGPLDLLLSLITKNKIDIYDIPISLILDQYMEYLDKMQKMDMDIAGEFIAMASQLMLIKSRMLIPRNEENGEEDPRAELAAALIEYKKAKEAAVMLNDLFKVYSGRVAKETDEFPAKKNEKIEDQDVGLLGKAFVRLINRSHARRMVSVPERIVFTLKYLIRHGKSLFDSIMLTCSSRSELVATFMAVLELAKGGRIFIETDENENVLISLNKGKITSEENDRNAG